MAFQNGRKNRSVETTATGNAKDTGVPVSQPPVKRVAAKLDFGGKGDQGYGSNRYGGPSSLNPGQTMESPLATDLRTTAAAGGDDVLETVQKFGAAAMRSPLPGDEVENVKGLPASQLRDVSNNGYPPAYGMAKRGADQGSPGGTVPATIGATSAPVARKPGA
jgi:hypothetical protein